MLRVGLLKPRLRTLKRAIVTARQRLFSTTEIRMYVCNLDGIQDGMMWDCRIQLDCWNDFEAFDAKSRWLGRDEFLTEAEGRLEAGDHAYTLVEQGRLVLYGWLVAPADRSFILEVGAVAEFPTNSAYAYDFFTHPAFRNRGLYQAALRHVQVEAKRRWRAGRLYIGVAPENVRSVHAIEKVGFRYDYSLFQQWRWNRVCRWSTQD